jgi:hypothetical protein
MLQDPYLVDGDPLMENLPSSLNVEAARLLVAIIRKSRLNPKGRRWNFEDKVSFLKHSPKSYVLLRSLFLLPSWPTLPSALNTVHFKTGINANVFGALQHSRRTCLVKTGVMYGKIVCCSHSAICSTIIRYYMTWRKWHLQLTSRLTHDVATTHKVSEPSYWTLHHYHPQSEIGLKEPVLKSQRKFRVHSDLILKGLYWNWDLFGKLTTFCVAHDSCLCSGKN